MDSPFLFLILFFSSFLQAYIFPVALTWHAHTCGGRQEYYPVCYRKGPNILDVAPSRFSYLPKSALPQHPVLSECVFSDWLPDGTQIQQDPLIDGYVVSIKSEILSAELNAMLTLFPVQRVGLLGRNFTVQTDTINAALKAGCLL